MLRFAAIFTAAVVFGFVALGFTGISPLLEPLEQRLLFTPRGSDAGPPASAFGPRASGVEEVRLATGDGVTLHGWLKRPALRRSDGRYPLVIVYGGARKEISDFLRSAQVPAEWGWLMVNYRGFGQSGGRSSERAVIADAVRIYDWAAARPDVDTSSIVLLGRSLGSYVAVAVAAVRKARAAILLTPFDSFVALGVKRFPSLPIDWLLAGRYDPAAIAPSVSVPALFVLAENDDVTPMEHGQALARAWGGLTQTVLLRGASHYGVERRDEFWRSTP
jgi:uncharacterized protein